MEEIWKVIDGYPNYMVSNLGKVKSLDRYINCPLNGKRLIKGKELKKHLNKNGYYYVCLTKNGKSKHHTIHSIIAKHFIPNPENKPCIDHINTDRTDNRVENLRWCTHKENMNNPLSKNNITLCKIGRKQSCETIEKRVSKLRGKPRTEDVKKQISISNSKPILQFDLNDNKISYFNSIKEAKEKTGIKTIIDNLSGRQKTAGGYKWGYADDYERIPFKVFDLEIYRKKVA